MKYWQKIWLYLLIVYSSIHLIRDIFQDTGLRNFLSIHLTKSHLNFAPTWFKYNTYPIEILLILLAIMLLKKNRFGIYGYFSMIIAFFMLSGWFLYWFYL